MGYWYCTTSHKWCRPTGTVEHSINRLLVLYMVHGVSTGINYTKRCLHFPYTINTSRRKNFMPNEADSRETPTKLVLNSNSQ